MHRIVADAVEAETVLPMMLQEGSCLPRVSESEGSVKELVDEVVRLEPSEVIRMLLDSRSEVLAAAIQVAFGSCAVAAARSSVNIAPVTVLATDLIVVAVGIVPST